MNISSIVRQSLLLLCFAATAVTASSVIISETGNARALVTDGISRKYRLAVSEVIPQQKGLQPESQQPPAQSEENEAPEYYDLSSSYGERASADRLPSLERISIQFDRSTAFIDGGRNWEKFPSFKDRFAGKVAALSQKDEFVFFSLDPSLQDYIEQLTDKVRASHVAVVAINPSTGAVLALAGRSSSISNLPFHAGFPAASLFKVVTAAAAIETKEVNANTIVRFRGGDYTLGKQNYLANPRFDRRSMSIGEALGRSCNPVFGRITSEFLSGPALTRYARFFGFNADLPCEFEVPKSEALIPSDNNYELARTGAGFGDVFVSPLHAATIMGAIANNGQMMRPSFVSRVIAPNGMVLYRAKPQPLRQIISPQTAEELREMMLYTTTIGTSRKEFMYRNRPVFPNVQVPAKTGTLNGVNPKGLNNWFIASAPLTNPQIAVAVIVVNPSDARAKAAHIGKMVIGKYLGFS